MDTEHKFNPGDAVWFSGYRPGTQDAIGKVKYFHGNKIYTVEVCGSHEWAYEHELRAIPIDEQLRLSIAQAKAKKGDAA